MKDALLPGFGGPMGRHARKEGVWFDPMPWALIVATLLFAALYLRHLPCLQSQADEGVDTFVRLCYTDIQTSFISQGLATGDSVFGGQISLAPLVAVVVAATVWLTSVLGGEIPPDAVLQTQLDALPLFFGLSALVLFGCFLVTVTAAVLMGPDSGNARFRSWFGLAVAGSPIVFAAGLIDWSLLPIGLTMFGLLGFARGRVLEAGVLLGLAASAGTMPIAVWLAVAVAVVLRGDRRAVAAFLVPSIGTFLAVHVPLMLNQPGVVFNHYVAEINKGTSDGSLLYLLEHLLRFESREVGGLFFAARLLVLGVVIAWLYVTRRRPRVGSLVGVFVLITVLLAPGFTPQTGLWVLIAVYLARPFREELVLTAVTHTAYVAAIWAWLSGHLSQAENGPEGVYFWVLLARAAVEAWVLASCLIDVARPGSDRLRTPDLSDPIGGVLVDGEELKPLKAVPSTADVTVG
ncbi:glycosyltransferase 87 family protein [Tessaracoccus caeni]|uniref:glycosyltransferase 87 family protein n=1 Tax=Tessaracoccus caeni TaxID=3031239 RepID=UPI0023DBE9E4|nr:glycosyltransferase 87 family protein [Tessaracoccus caeni]MDF1487504.1 glycosyltransferase 87 family protein [Tessaracoccus caeni]